MNARNYISGKTKKKSMPHLSMIIMLSFLLFTFVSCGSDGSSTGSNNNENPNGPEEPVEQQGANEVWLEGTTFNVANLEVSVGTTVTWTNKSSVNHTVTSGIRGEDDAGDLFDSGTLSPGETFDFKFEEAGSYDYYCGFHPNMTAKVTVTE